MDVFLVIETTSTPVTCSLRIYQALQEFYMEDLPKQLIGKLSSMPEITEVAKQELTIV